MPGESLSEWNCLVQKEAKLKISAFKTKYVESKTSNNMC